jgi:hypothetical protein
MAEARTARDEPSGSVPPGPLDVWLHRALRRRFDAVLREPLPPDLLRLLGGPGHPQPCAEAGAERHAPAAGPVVRACA